MQEGSLNPSITGQTLKLVNESIFEGSSPLVLVVKKIGNTPEELYAMRKEDFFTGVFQDMDISQKIFEDPLFDTSYQDLIPGTWTGLPNMSLIGMDSPQDWIVQYFRNPNINEWKTKGGAQIVKCDLGIEFIRYSKNQTWGPWQLVSSNPFGLISAGLFKNNVTNNLGWLPLNGVSYAKSKYPELWKVLEGKVASDDLTFTLPNLSGNYLSAPSAGKEVGTFDTWKVPNVTDRIGLISGASASTTLFRDKNKRVGKLFQVEREDDTTQPYLSDVVVVNPVTGDPIEGDGSGLTSYLKFDVEEGYGSEHVTLNNLIPNTFYTGFFIYAGYPQN